MSYEITLGEEEIADVRLSVPSYLQAPVLGTREAANQRSLCQRT